ncbi:MAG: hypothetical protein NT121_22525, partial [Chloroflexi bacterium]|nr:hypothetical protein [Chloroflexota bacterium]
TLTPECSGFGYRHDFDSDKEQYFCWIVPVPKGTVTGRIKHGNQTYFFLGVGYHDHNWASVSLSEKIQSWQWGRYLDADLALIFASVTGNEETLFQGMALIQQSDLASEYQYLKFDHQGPTIRVQETPEGWNLSIRKRLPTLSVTGQR